MSFGFGAGIQRLGSVSVETSGELDAITPGFGMRPVGFVWTGIDRGVYKWTNTEWERVADLPSDRVSEPISTGGLAYRSGIDRNGDLVRGAAIQFANDRNFQSSRTSAQNRVAIEAAIADVVGDGGGIVRVAPSEDPYEIEPFECPINVVIDGLHPMAAEFYFDESAGTDFITFVLASGLYFWGGLRNLSIRNGGSAVGGNGISTPVDGDGFSDVTHWLFETMQFRGAGFEKYLAIGDANQGVVEKIEWRGPYNPTITDVGQADMTAIDLSAATGNIGVAMDKLMIVGVRRGLHLGDNCEGFSLTNSEFVAAWDAIVADPVASKPGGFIDNVHMNVQHRGISATRKRDLQIGKVQCYRSNGWFDHTGDWKGIALDTCGGVSIDHSTVRIAPGAYVNDSGMIGVEVKDSSQTGIGRIITREAAAVDTVLKVINSAGGTIDGMITNGDPTWIDIDATSEDWSFGPVVNQGSAPSSTPYKVGSGMSAARRRTVSFNRKATGFQNYTDHGSYSAAGTDTLYCGFSGETHKFSLAVGSGSYTRNIELDKVNAVDGDRFRLKFTFLNSTNPTVVIKDAVGGSTLATLNNGTGANWFPCLDFVFNSAGWVLESQVNSVV